MQIESISLLAMSIFGIFLIIEGCSHLIFLKNYQNYPLVKICFNEITIAKTAGTGMDSENPMYYIKGIFTYKSNNLSIIQYDSGLDASFYRFFNYEEARIAIDKWIQNGCLAYINIKQNKLILDIPISIKYKNQHFTTIILSGILLNITTFILLYYHNSFL